MEQVADGADVAVGHEGVPSLLRVGVARRVPWGACGYHTTRDTGDQAQ